MNDTSSPWPTMPLRELAREMCLGKMLDKNKNRGTMQPYLRNVNVRWFTFDLSDLKEMRFEEGEEERFGLRDGDLVICEGGEPGRAAVWKGQAEDAKIQKALHRVRFGTDEYDPHFAMYFVYYGTITQRFARHYTGTTIKHLTGKALSRIEFPVPPLNEQRRIVAKIEELFSDLDAGVAALERAKANLKRYRAAVLKAAVEGRLTQEWRSAHPDIEPASELLKRILSERRRKWEADKLAEYESKGKKPPNNWKDKYKEPAGPDTSKLSDLPDGWCWATVPQLADSCLGKMLDRKKHTEGEPLPYLRNVNVRWRSVDTDDLLEMYFDADEEVRFGLKAGDVLVCEGGEPGRASVWLNQIPNMRFQKALHRVRCTEGLFPSFLVIVLEHLARSGRLERFFTGSTIKHFTGVSFAKMPLPLPPIEEQKQIAERVDYTLSSIDRADRDCHLSIIRASRLRQSILQKAFAGKLVPQDPNAESAKELLARIKKTRDALSSTNAKGNKQGKKRMAMKRRPLIDVLQEYPDGLSPDSLLKESGRTLENIEDFYRELRSISDRIEELRPEGVATNQWPADVQITLRMRSA